MLIGVGISTTPNRKLLDHTLKQWYKYLPVNAKFVIEEDTNYAGVAATKNKLLAQLDDCDHIFLSDDDCWPISPRWHVPYIASREPHLMYQFKLPHKPDSDMRELYRDKEIVAYSHTRGAMIYIERRVLDIVGGMDTLYGQAMFEHPDWTNRIYNAGLTTFRAMDVVNSNQLFYCLDEDGETKSSISPSVKLNNTRRNRALYQRSKTSREFKEYRNG